MATKNTIKPTIKPQEKPQNVNSKRTSSREKYVTIFAGALAGVVSRTATAPLERLKVFMQVHGDSPYKLGVLGSVYQMLKNEGIRGSLRGNGVNCLKVIPTSSVKFLAFETFKKYLMPPGCTQLPVPPAGAAAGITATLCTHPLDVARTRLTLQRGPVETHKYHGLLGTLKTIAKEEGVPGLYSGITASIANVAPFNGINFCAYEFIKETTERFVKSKSVLLPTLYGAVSGCIAMTALYPFDVVRHAMMATHAQQRSGTFKVASNIYQSHGIGGFYRGIMPSYLKVIPTVSLTFFTYEAAKRLLL